MNLIQSFIGLFLFVTASANTPYIAPSSTIDILPLSTTTQAIIEPVIVDKEQETACSCILSARKHGLRIPYPSDAKDLIPNSSPNIDSGILFYFPKTDTHHVAVIKKFLREGFWVIEGNKIPCQITERLVSYTDKFIIGFVLY